MNDDRWAMQVGRSLYLYLFTIQERVHVFSFSYLVLLLNGSSTSPTSVGKD